MPCVILGSFLNPAGTVCDELMGTIDLFPSLAITKKIPSKKKIDGLDASHLILGSGSTPRRNFFTIPLEEYWKVFVLKTGNFFARNQGIKTNRNGYAFSICLKIWGRNNLAQEQPAIVARLSSRMQELDGEIEKNASIAWFKKLGLNLFQYTDRFLTASINRFCFLSVLYKAKKGTGCCFNPILS